MKNLLDYGTGNVSWLKKSLNRNKATYLRKTPTQGLLDCEHVSPFLSLPLHPSSISRANELTLVACVERHPVGPESPEAGVTL